MLNYLKNFTAKVLLLPILALLGVCLLIFFVVLPQFKLFKDKEIKHWRAYYQNTRGKYGNQKEESKDYEAFY